MKLNEFYSTIGGDYTEAKARFQSDERIARFLKMFPGDDSMQNLSAAVAANDAPTAFRAVHTLKGVALNLGFGALAAVSSEMTEALRGSDTLPTDPSSTPRSAASMARCATRSSSLRSEAQKKRPAAFRSQGVGILPVTAAVR